MAKKITTYDVFIASPRGLEEEREHIVEIFESFNKYRTLDAKIAFKSVDYRVAPGGMGRPQSQINEFIRESDFFILLMYDKWGTPPFSSQHSSKYSSGTEEEFYLARECFNDENMPMKEILLIFKALEPKRLEDPGEELKKVLAFKTKLENEKICLYETFDSEKKFRDVVEKNLSRWLNNIVKESYNKEEKASVQSISESLDNNYIDIDNKLLRDKNKALSEIKALTQIGQFSRVELMFARLNTMYPDNFDVCIEYARFYTKRGLLQYAIEVLNKLSSIPFLSDIHNAILSREKGIIEMMRGNNKEAETQYRASIELLVSGKTEEYLKERANSLIELGGILRKQGRYEESETELNHALDIYTTLNDIPGQVTVYEYLGLTYKALGHIEAAENSYANALKYIDDTSDEMRANILGNLGVILRMKGDFGEAREKHDEAYKIFARLGDKMGQERELGNLGIVYRRLRDYDMAAEMHSNSLKLAKECGHTSNIIVQLDNLGITALEKEDYDMALSYHYQALGINESIHNKRASFYQLRNIGSVYIKQGEYDSARDILLQANEVIQNNEFEQALTNSKLAKAYLGLGDKVQAYKYAKSAYEVLRASAPGYDNTKEMELLMKEIEADIEK